MQPPQRSFPIDELVVDFVLGWCPPAALLLGSIVFRDPSFFIYGGIFVIPPISHWEVCGGRVKGIFGSKLFAYPERLSSLQEQAGCSSWSQGFPFHLPSSASGFAGAVRRFRGVYATPNSSRHFLVANP
jgi:hypothetical protein